MVRIEGFIRAETALHQTRPGVEGFLGHTASGRQIVSFVKTRKGPVQVQMSSSFVDDAGMRYEMPIITGNSLRGVLRRKATARLLRAMGQPVRTELFQCLSVGSAHRRDIGGQKTAQMITAGVENIFAGLFGGGGASLTSHYSAADMFPLTERSVSLVPPWVAQAAPVMPRGQNSDGDKYDQLMTTIFATIKRDPLLDGEGKYFVVDHDEEFMAAQGAGLKAKKGGKAADEAEGEQAEAEGSGLRNMTYVEAIPAGTPMSFSIQLRPQMKDYHIGMMLLALDEWVNDQKLGGASRRGFGRFAPTLRLYDESGSDPVQIDLFRKVATSDGGSISGYALSPEVRPYLDAADAELGKQSIVLLENLYLAKKAA